MGGEERWEGRRRSFWASLGIEFVEGAGDERDNCLTNVGRKMGPGPRYFFEVWLQNSVRIGQEPTFAAIFVLSKMLTAVFAIFASRYFTTTYKVEAAGIESARRIFATSVLQST